MGFLRAIARNTGNLVALAMAAAVVFAVAGTFLVAACGGVAPLPPGESCMQCAREWVGSLAGWVAAVAAFFTVWAIKAQITQTHLLSERDRLHTLYETSHTAGDALLRISEALRHMSSAADTISRDCSGNNLMRWQEIVGAHGLKAINSREKHLQNSEVEAFHSIVEATEALWREIGFGFHLQISAAALHLRHECTALSEVVNQSAVRYIERARWAEVQLVNVERSLGRLSGA